MLNPSSIKEIIRDRNLHINKKLGQNFLIDPKKRDRMVGLCRIKKHDTVLEIGPGMGALTEEIITKCKRLIAIEKDRGLASFLKERFKEDKNIEILNRDILKYDIKEAGLKEKIKVAGNLPYYITSPIIFHLLKYKPAIESIFITIQKEVAERIKSKPGTKAYGVLSCILQYHFEVFNLLNIPRGAFFPMPDVDSSFLELKVRKKPPVAVGDEELLFKIIKASFNKRRKTISNSLSNNPTLNIDKDILKEAFNKAGIDAARRAETLGLEEFAVLTDCLSSLLY